MTQAPPAPTVSEQGTRGARPLVGCRLAAALFGISSPLSKSLLADLTPLTLAGFLYLGAALAVLPFSFRGGSPAARRSKKNILRMAGVVVFGGALGPALLLFGLSQAPAASVSLWLNLEAPATAVLGWLFFKEHLDKRVVAAVVLVTIASAVLAGASGFSLVPAALLITGACVCWGLDNNLSATVDGFTPAQSTLAKGIAAGGANLALGLFTETPKLGALNVSEALLLGSLAYGASIVLYVRAAQQLGAVRSQLIFSTAPFFGVVIAWTALREPVQATQIAAGVLMIGALALLHRERHGHAHVHEEITHTHWHRHDDDHHQDHAHDPPVTGGHVHEHHHRPVTHDHAHRPDLHHRHSH
jgi:drug/metabolite transporter (DMT)-like permease